MLGSRRTTASSHRLQPHDAFSHFAELHQAPGWYDFTVQVESNASFKRQLAGHVETGKDRVTDPAIGTALPLAFDGD